MIDVRRDAKARELLLPCAAGDARALEALYELAAPVLFGLLTRMLRRRALAEEALQEVFISIWQRSGQYQSDRGRAPPWFRSALSACARSYQAARWVWNRTHAVS